jgi:hypothetical protein
MRRDAASSKGERPETMAKLKTELESLDGLDDALKGLYVE